MPRLSPSIKSAVVAPGTHFSFADGHAKWCKGNPAATASPKVYAVNALLSPSNESPTFHVNDVLTNGEQLIKFPFCVCIDAEWEFNYRVRSLSSHDYSFITGIWQESGWIS